MSKGKTARACKKKMMMRMRMMDQFTPTGRAQPLPDLPFTLKTPSHLLMIPLQQESKMMIMMMILT